MGNFTTNSAPFRMQEMALTLGIDLASVQFAGLLRQTELAGMFVRCSGCSVRENCADWLSEPNLPRDAAPVWCANKAQMDRLVSES